MVIQYKSEFFVFVIYYEQSIVSDLNQLKYYYRITRPDNINYNRLKIKMTLTLWIFNTNLNNIKNIKYLTRFDECHLRIRNDLSYLSTYIFTNNNSISTQFYIYSLNKIV